MNKGKIVQVMGPVVDVVFEDGQLPNIKDALEVENNGKRCVMEVSQHLGNNIVRCIMLGASEGLQRDREVTATGSGIKVPVGDKTLGRLFNVLGDTVDGGESLEGEEHWVIHRDPPSFEEQKPAVEILETGIKVIDLLAPYAKGGKIGLFGGAGVGKSRPEHVCVLLRQDLPWQSISVIRNTETYFFSLIISSVLYRQDLRFPLCLDVCHPQ